MAKRINRSVLTKLEEQRKALDAEIRAAKQEQRKQEAQLAKKRFALMGKAIAAELPQNDDLLRQLEPYIDKHTTRAADRRLLRLAPLPKAAKPVPAATSGEGAVGKEEERRD